MNRRTFLRNSLLIGGVGALTGLYAWQVEPFFVDYVQLKMNIDHLPDELVGKKLIQISDTHVGDRVDGDFLKETFKNIQRLNPDFVVYTGDFVDYAHKKQFQQLNDIFEYAPKGKLGTVGVLGNHDYGWKWSQDKVADKIVEILENKGITALRNQQKQFSGLNIVGIDDYWATNFHPEEVMPKVMSRQANLVLCHNPDVVDLDVWDNYKGWILSGHTHGGQVKAPFLPPLILPVKNKDYSQGEIELGDGRTLYINRALGYLHQVRFNVRPEVTVFELVKR